MFKVACENDDEITPLRLKRNSQQNEDPDANVVVEDVGFKKKIDSWKQKQLHGAHPNFLQQDYVDKSASNMWLKKGNLYGETVGFMMAIQDRVIKTKNYRKYILKENIDDRCRKCGSKSENIEHIINGCESIAQMDYTKRHDNVAKIVHQSLAKRFNLTTSGIPYYKYEPANVLENENYKMYWDREIRTDKRMKANRPDILVLDKKKKEVDIIDITVPLNHNIQSAYATKVNKYTDLAAEINDMWKLKKVRIRPLVISATAVVPKSLIKQLDDLQLQDQLSSIQKSVVLDTCHIVRRFLAMQ